MSTPELNVVPRQQADTASASRYVIETQQLTLRYGRKTALKSLDLKIPQGRIHAIVGANGAGKTSLFRILLGFQWPTSGSASILGRDCGALNEHGWEEHIEGKRLARAEDERASEAQQRASLLLVCRLA